MLSMLKKGLLKVTKAGRVKNMITGNWIGEGSGEGYVTLELRHPKTDKIIYVSKHRLVYLAIKGPIPKGHTVNHEDGNKRNNHPNNLEAMEHADNIDHSYRTGLQPPIPKGEDNWNAKLTNKQVKDIKRLYAKALKEAQARGKTRVIGEFSTRGLAKTYGVSYSLVSAIILEKKRNL